MEIQPIIINFKSQNEVVEQAYQVILKTINEAFAAAKGDLKKMEELHELGKELVFYTAIEMDRLRYGEPLRKEETTQPDCARAS